MTTKTHQVQDPAPIVEASAEDFPSNISLVEAQDLVPWDVWEMLMVFGFKADESYAVSLTKDQNLVAGVDHFQFTIVGLGKDTGLVGVLTGWKEYGLVDTPERAGSYREIGGQASVSWLSRYDLKLASRLADLHLPNEPQEVEWDVKALRPKVTSSELVAWNEALQSNRDLQQHLFDAGSNEAQRLMVEWILKYREDQTS